MSTKSDTVKLVPEKLDSVKVTSAKLDPAKLNFSVGDKIVYPGHGVGEIEAVVSRALGGAEQKFFSIIMLDGKGTKIMVPLVQAVSVGLRKVMDKKSVDKVFEILKNRKFKMDTQTWNRRHREYTQKLRTGSPFEVAEVVRDLAVLGNGKDLSFGEKKMLESAQSLLVSEVAIVKSRPHEKVMGEIQALFVAL